jgi:apolipoprotein N-acyltransferase
MQNSKLKALKENGVFWGIFTGVLYATSYPPFPAWALFFSWVPLWAFWVRATRLKQVLISGFAAQFVLTLIGFNWIAHTATEYGHIPFVLSLLIMLGFCCFAGLNVVITGVVAWYVQRKARMPLLWYLIFLAVLSAFSDWMYPTIFPWNTAYPLLWSGFKSSQLAEYVGFNLLSIPVYLANVCFALAWLRFPQKKWSRPLLIFVAGLFIFESLGILSTKLLGREDSLLNVLVVQPNIGNYDKYYAERGDGYQQPIIDKDLEYTREGLKATPTKPDVIVWPETAFPANLDPYFMNSVYAQQLRKFVDDNDVTLITGAYSEDPITERERKSYNAVFALEPKAQPAPGYRKHILLAFGEYFPGAQYMPFLKNLVPEISDFGRGEGSMVIRARGIVYSPLICYEGLDTSYVAGTVHLGGQILVNVTNDSWFGDFFEPRQHMIMTVARTIEYRRPLVRVTNTGITIIADSTGKILSRGPQNRSWSDTLQLPYFQHPKTTLFSRIVGSLTFIFLGLAILTVFLGISAKENKNEVPRT